MKNENKTECCNAKVEGVMEYAREDPWGAVGGHYECSECKKEVMADGGCIECMTGECKGHKSPI